MDSLHNILAELKEAVDSVELECMDRLEREILKAERVYVAGMGRSGLVAKCFAMRLAQMGILSYVVGQETTTAIAEEDLLILLSGSGNTDSLVLFAKKAREVGAAVALITVSDTGKAVRDSSLLIKIPVASSKASSIAVSKSIQPMGSLFEQSALLILDGLVLKLMSTLKETSETMMRRHANLE